MGKVDLFEDGQVTAVAAAVGGGGPLTYSVHRENGRILESGVEKAARGMRLVVLVRQDASLEAHPLTEVSLDTQDIEVRQPGPRTGALLRPQLPGELLGGRFIIGESIDLIDADSAVLQAESKRFERQTRIVLDAGEALLFGRGDQLTVAQEATGRLVIARGQADDLHPSAPSGQGRLLEELGR